MGDGMLKLSRIAVAGIALIMGLMVMAAPATAYLNGLGYIYLTTDGGDDLDGSDWKFYVETPIAVGLDADYWNLTVYADPLNDSATNTTYYVLVYIVSGEANISKNCTIEAKNDVRIYSNCTYEAADWATITEENKSATLSVYLQESAEYTLVDGYTQTLFIYEHDYMAGLITLLCAVIPIVIIIALFDQLKISGKGKSGGGGFDPR